MSEPEERVPGPAGRLAAFMTATRARVYSSLVVVVVLGGYLVSIGAGPLRSGGFTDLSGALIGADFSAFYWAGHAVVLGESDRLYDIEAEAAFLDHLRAPAPSQDEVHAFVSPPYWALFFAPLGALPYPLALLLFWALSFAVLWLVVRLVASELPLEALGSHPRKVALSIAFFPVLFSFLNGQTSMLLLGVLAATFVLLRRGQDFFAGLMLGLLVVKPQLMVGPAILLLCAGRGRALVGATLSASVWLFLGFVLLRDAMAEYLVVAPELMEFLRLPDYETWGQTSLFGLATLLLDPLSHDAGTWVGYALVLAALGTIAVLALRLPWSPGSARWDLTMAAVLGLGFIGSLHLFLYDASLFLLPLAIVVSRFPPRGERLLDGGRLLAASATMGATLFFGPYLTLGVQSWLRERDVPHCALQLCTLAMVWFVVEVARRAASEPTA